MIAPLTPNTQAILLLTAPLIVGRSDSSLELLTLSEYNRLARLLREKQKEPADLIGSTADETVGICAAAFDRKRMESLLGRGFLLSQAVERWNARAIWVVSRADSSYPRRLKARLKEDAPPVLYGCGDAALLDTGGLAVVGSRHVDDELISYTETVGKLAAEARRTLVSGAAKGIDRAAMHGALQAGGKVAGVMSDSLERGALARDNREPLMDRNLVLISPYDPAAGFNVGHAMQRNKVIYALADAALVVTSDFEKGGTWAGAIEQLEKLHFVPVFVRSVANAGKGNSALLKQGAVPWPHPSNPDELSEALSTAAAALASEPKQETLSFALREKAAPYGIPKETMPSTASLLPAQGSSLQAKATPAEALYGAVREILSRELTESKNEAQVAELLSVSKSQAKAWLTRLVADGALEKTAKPLRYRAAKNTERLL
ncbi:MAG: DNA-protecting protein DprA [Verrucomicrobia bacterium]|nr:DNA-protecting protein DprA [Verrucomicrobiota bacterium]